MAVYCAAKPFPSRPGGAPIARHWIVRQITFIHLNQSDPSDRKDVYPILGIPNNEYILYRLLIITRFSRAAWAPATLSSAVNQADGHRGPHEISFEFPRTSASCGSRLGERRRFDSREKHDGHANADSVDDEAESI